MHRRPSRHHCPLRPAASSRPTAWLPTTPQPHSLAVTWLRFCWDPVNPARRTPTQEGGGGKPWFAAFADGHGVNTSTWQILSYQHNRAERSWTACTADSCRLVPAPTPESNGLVSTPGQPEGSGQRPCSGGRHPQAPRLVPPQRTENWDAPGGARTAPSLGTP